MNQHEFRVERWGHDHANAYDEECQYARRRARRRLLGVGGALALKLAISFLVFHVAGWWGVAALATVVLVLLFLRGLHAYPGLEH